MSIQPSNAPSVLRRHAYVTPPSRSALATSNTGVPVMKFFARTSALLVLLAAVIATPTRVAHAQMGGGGGGGQSSTAAPAASSVIKKNLDRSDPLNFLLERKKPLELTKTLEDSLKLLRKEMQRMQEVVYKDLDKAASTKTQGQPPAPPLVLSMTRESEERVRDIQAAYRDRARAMLSEAQVARADSLEVDWKRTLPRADALTVRRPPL